MPTKIAVILSLAVHAAAVALVAVGLPWADRPVPDKGPMLVSQILLTDSPPEPSGKTQDKTRSEKHPPQPEDAPPVEYAGAPPGDPKPLEHPEPKQTPEPAPAVPAAAANLPAEKPFQQPRSATVASESELAAVSDRLRETGVKVPALDLQGVTLGHLEAIAAAQQGMFIARCGDKDYAVVGSLTAPQALTPMAGQQGNWLSDRSAWVSGEQARAVRERLLWDYSYPRDKVGASTVRLSFGNRLDRLMLWRQEEAASNLGVQLDAVLRTAGKFVWSNGAVTDFEVVTVTLRDGRTVPVGTTAGSALVARSSATEKGGNP
jgi:hypothetical protein